MLSGERKSLDDYRGQWLLVNFWAEWCSPCLEEFPELNQLAQAKSEQGIQVIGISYDPLSNTDLKQKVEDLNILYPVMATDPVPVLPFGLPPTLPTNYLISPQGEVVAKLVGKQSAHSINKVIQEYRANSGRKE